MLLSHWLLIDETGIEKTVILLSIGLVFSYIIAVMASLPPITEISLSANEALRVFSPVAFPFCIQQYHDYGAQLFSNAVCFGWPEGIPLLRFALRDDQSEFIHEQHYLSGLNLGLLLLLGMTIFVGILFFIDRRCTISRKKLRVSSFLIIFLQFTLITLMIYLYIIGNTVYPLGGLVVLLITLHPSIQTVHNRNS
ncbi:hypothetical protein EU527_06230 [Candidatus Thorarchaeota archaeon]|nr:MAG: hypothetical protein EU527_06230 [Candidatus Thorarchaeota archaeon]